MAAPTKLVLDFLHAVGENEYDLALRIVEKVLQFEPRNPLMIEYKSVLERAIKMRDEEAVDVEDETDDDDEVIEEDDDEDCDDDGEDDGEDDDEDSSKDESDEDEHQQSRAAVTDVTLDEIQEDLDNFGLEGTREELVSNLRWIVQNSPCNGTDATSGSNLGVEEAKADSKLQDAK